MTAYPKTRPARDEAYRRLVAALPCVHCGVHGYSQAAHGPALGRGIKASDLDCVPLCCDRPLVVGCHTLFDRYLLADRAERPAVAQWWAAETRRQLEGL